jgi:Plasmid pRiA4b ORF-3-like protein
MEKLISEGNCVFCQETFNQSGMSRHLATHLSQLPATKHQSFHLNISAGEMFLHVQMDGSATLGQLDDFLRAIWLECCGHMSSFEVKGKKYDNNWDDMDTEIGESQAKKASQLFKKDMILDYQYDFGSTTQLSIKVMGEYPVATPKDIKLLSRNNPLKILCHVCNEKPAVQICSVCVYDGEGMLCKSCATKHKKKCDDFADYAAMKLVNSPRMGTCAYEGGTIDVARDGVWKP